MVSLAACAAVRSMEPAMPKPPDPHLTPPPKPPSADGPAPETPIPPEGNERHPPGTGTPLLHRQAPSSGQGGAKKG
jgi:hypothetical protein